MYMTVHIIYNGSMDGKHKTSMTDLRKDLASYLRVANSGEQVIITVDGKPFASLGPLEAQNEITIDHLVAGGLVNKPLRDQPLGDPEAAILPADSNVSAIIREVRG
tara:strand:+ start:54 stop:371 length:318 start_codon:yes stop_codon:yes gene_type:complete